MKNYFDLTGKVALITGASSGLGVQFAKALGNQGAKLSLVARRLEKLEEVKKELESLGYEVSVERCDVTNTDDIRNAVKGTIDKYGTIDILVNNAGVGRSIKAEEQTDEEWNMVMDTNLNSVYYFCREVGKTMIEKGYGKIINVGSIHSTVSMGAFPLSSYCATKGGVLMLTKSLATEWARHNITVNAIGPSYFESEMTKNRINSDDFNKIMKTYCPMGRAGRQGELNGGLIYFASDASSFTTGQLLHIDGGWTSI